MTRFRLFDYPRFGTLLTVAAATEGTQNPQVTQKFAGVSNRYLPSYTLRGTVELKYVPYSQNGLRPDYVITSTIRPGKPS